MSIMPIYGGQRPEGLIDGYSLMGMQAPSAAPAFNPLSFLLQAMFSQQPAAPIWDAGGYGGLGTGGYGNYNMGEIRQPGGGYGNWGGGYGGGFGGGGFSMSPLISLLSLLQSFRAPTAPSGIPAPQGNPAANTVPASQSQFGNRNTPLTRPINSSVFNPAPSGPSQDRSRAYTRGSSAY